MADTTTSYTCEAGLATQPTILGSYGQALMCLECEKILSLRRQKTVRRVFLTEENFLKSEMAVSINSRYEAFLKEKALSVPHSLPIEVLCKIMYYAEPDINWIRLLHDIETNPGPKKRANPYVEFGKVVAVTSAFAGLSLLVTRGVVTLTRELGLDDMVDNAARRVAQGTRDGVRLFSHHLVTSCNTVSNVVVSEYEEFLAYRIVMARKRKIALLRAYFPTSVVADIMEFEDPDLNWVKLVHDVEVNPGPVFVGTKPVILPLKIDGQFRQWIARGKSAYKFLRKHEALFNELGFLLDNLNDENYPRYQEILTTLLPSGFIELAPVHLDEYEVLFGLIQEGRFVEEMCEYPQYQEVKKWKEVLGFEELLSIFKTFENASALKKFLKVKLVHDIESNPGPFPRFGETVPKSYYNRLAYRHRRILKKLKDRQKPVKKTTLSSESPSRTFDVDSLLQDLAKWSVEMCSKIEESRDTRFDLEHVHEIKSTWENIQTNSPMKPQAGMLDDFFSCFDRLKTFHVDLSPATLDALMQMKEGLSSVNINHSIGGHGTTEKPIGSGILESIKNFMSVDNSQDIVIGILVLLGSLGLGYTVCRLEVSSLAKALISISSLAVTFYYGGTWFAEQINNLLSNVPEEEEGFVPQGPGFLDWDTEPLVTAVCGCVYWLIFKTTPDTKFLTTFVKTIGDLTKFKNGISTLVDMLIDVIRRFCNWLATVPGYEAWTSVPGNNSKVHEVALKLNQLIAQLRDGAHYDAVNAEQLFKFEKELREALVNTPKSREFQGEVHAIESLLATIGRLAPLFVGYAKNGPRVPPTCVLLVGPPRTGKSVNTLPIIMETAARNMSDVEWQEFVRNHNDSIFNWMTEQEFFEGYHGQPFWVIDEALQQKDSQLKPDPGVFGLIRASNTMAYVLNMAHCDSKGNMMAHPKFIFGTSNVNVLSIDSIKSPEAYAKRWDIVYLQVPKKEYCVDGTAFEAHPTDGLIWKRRLDTSKVPIVENGYYLDISDFYAYDILTGHIINMSPLNFDQIITEIDRVHKNKNKGGQKLLDFHLSYKQDLDRLRSQNFANARANNFSAQSGEVEILHPDEASKRNIELLNANKNKEPEKSSETKHEELKLKHSGIFKRKVKGKFVPQAGEEDDEGYNTADEATDDNTWRSKICSYLRIPHSKFDALCVKYNLNSDMSISTIWTLYKREFLYPVLDTALVSVETVFAHLSHRNVLIGLGVTLGLVGSVWYLMKPSVLVEQSGKAAKKSRTLKSLRIERRERKRAGMVIQDGKLSQNTIDVMKSICGKHLLKMSIEGIITDFGYMLLIGDKVALTFKHSIDLLMEDYMHREGLVLTLTPSIEGPGKLNMRIPIVELNPEIYPERFLQFEQDNEDILYIDLADFMSTRSSDISDFFSSEGDRVLDYQFYASLFLPERGKESSKHSFMSLCYPVKDYKRADGAMPHKDFDYGYDYVNAFNYHIATKAGDCGLPLFVTDSAERSPKICGMHTAGDTKTGLSIAVYKESVKDALKHFNAAPVNKATIVPLVKQCGSIPDNFEIVSLSQPISQAHKSKIVRAPLYGLFGPVDEAPAKLHKFTDKNGREIDPYYQARSKYNTPMPALSTPLLQDCIKYTARQLWQAGEGDLSRRPPQLWSFEEAVEGKGHIGHLRMDTSSGFPWCFSDCKKKKDIFYTVVGEIDYKRAQVVELRRLVDEKLTMLKQGMDVEFIFIDFLKDECRSLEKVEAGKTRLISSESTDLSIITRILFGDFLDYLLDTKISNGIAIGVNATGVNWQQLAMYLQQVGNNNVAGDHAGYDGRFSQRIWKACGTIAEQFYYNASEQERIARKTLLELISNSLHLAIADQKDTELIKREYLEHYGVVAEEFSHSSNKVGVIYKWNGCMPSGSTLTSAFDSLGGLVIDRYAIYMTVLKGQGVHHFSYKEGDLDLEREFRLVQSGDDNVQSFSDYLVNDLGVDQTSLTETFAEMGWKYTDETKTGLVHKTRPLEEVIFLQRRFTKLRGKWRSPLAYGSIDSRLFWRKETMTANEYKLNIRSAIAEYSQWGKEVFEDRARKIIHSAAETLQIRDLPNTWEEALSVCEGLEYYYF